MKKLTISKITTKTDYKQNDYEQTSLDWPLGEGLQIK